MIFKRSARCCVCVDNDVDVDVCTQSRTGERGAYRSTFSPRDGKKVAEKPAP